MYKIIIMLIFTSVLSGCATSSFMISDRDEALIYFTVTERMTGVDDTYGGNLNPHTIYIAGALTDTCKDNMDVNSCELINDKSRTMLTSMLSDKAAKTMVVLENEDAKRIFKDTKHDERVAMLGFQKIYFSRDGKAKITVNAKYGSGASTERTYILAKQGSGWVVESSKENWIS